MAQTAGGTYYAASSELVSSWPATSLDLANQLESRFAAKAPLALSINAQTGTSYTLAVADSGKVVTMTNAAASTVTIPTNASVAVPIGSCVEVVNLSTGVNTTVSAAGGVTFNGGPVVLSPGSSVTLVKIGTDAWMAQGQGSPGLVHIATGSATAASAITFNNIFTTTYENYLIVWNGITASGETDMYLRLRAAGSDNTNASYSYFNFAQGVNNTSYNQASTGTNQFIAGRIGPNGTSTLSMWIYRPQVAERTAISTQNTASGTTTVFIQTGGGIFVATTQFDGCTLYTASSTQTGTARVYGLRNS